MKILKNIIRVLLTVLLVGLIVYKVGPVKILGAFQNLNWGYFILALLAGAVVVFLKAFKWFILARAEDKDFSFGETFRAFLIGLGFSVITPSRVGELGRVFYLAKGDKLRLAGLVIIDKVFDFLMVGLLSFWGAFYFLGPQIGLLILLVSLALVGLFFWPPLVVNFLKITGGWLPFREKLKNVVLSLNLLNKKIVFQCFSITLISFLIMIVQFYLFLRAFGPAGIKVSFLCYPLILLTNLVPLTIGNLGIREGAAVFLLGHFGVLQQSAVNAAFLLFLVDTVIPGLIGALFATGMKNSR